LHLRAIQLRRAAPTLGVLFLGTLLTACGGGGGGGTADMGTLRVALTDAPSCGYDHVYTTVSKVSVHTSAAAGENDAGWTDLTLSPPRRIDLLALTNGVLEELGTMPLPAGNYSQVRLVLAANDGSATPANAVQPTGGALVPLNTPSAQQSGLKLQAHFEVKANQMADLVLDFDACRSVVKAGNSGQYQLKPVVSVTPRFTAGILGHVSTALPAAATTVSAQQNGMVVRSTAPDASGRFVLAYLPDGNYEVVVTSEGRSTAVITGVPVVSTTGTTTVTNVATAIAPPVSPVATVGGNVAVTGTATPLVTDATVRATQALTGGPMVQLAAVPVDATLATYTFRLPTAAPVRASYAVAGPTFTVDTAAGGLYALHAAAPGRTAVQQTVNVGSGGAITGNLRFAP
jgi:hypothetical protein